MSTLKPSTFQASSRSVITPPISSLPVGILANDKPSEIPLDVAENTRLVTIETARALLGINQAGVDAKIDDGSLWAFNISTRGRVREIRIWIRSLPGMNTRPNATLEDVIKDVAGTNAEIRCGAVQLRLCCDDNTVYRLFNSGLLSGEIRRAGRARTLWISTSSLTRFLGSRVVGAV